MAWPRSKCQSQGCMRRLHILLLLGCAPLNPATLSEPCRYVYNSCLNRCPKADSPPAGDSLPIVFRAQPNVAACTEQCNEQASSCR